MTNLEYLLKEGFVEIVYFPKDLQKFSRRIQVYLNQTPGVWIINSNLGKCIMDKKTGDTLLLDSELAIKYGVEKEVTDGLDVTSAVAALNSD